MVSAAESGEVKLWRVADGQLIRVVQATGDVTGVALSPDGSRLALCGSIESRSSAPSRAR